MATRSLQSPHTAVVHGTVDSSETGHSTKNEYIILERANATGFAPKLPRLSRRASSLFDSGYSRKAWGSNEMQECDRQWIVKVLRIPDWISRRRRYYSPAQKRYFTREESSGRPWNIVGPRAQCLAGKEVRMDFRLRESSSIEKWIDNPFLDAGKPDSFPRAPPNASDVHIFGGQHPDLSTIYIDSIPSAGFDRDWRIGRLEAAEMLGWKAVTLWDTRFLDASLGKNHCRRNFSWTLFRDWRIGRLEAAELLAERLCSVGHSVP